MLVQVKGGQTLEAQYRGLGPEQQAALLGLHHDNPGDTLARRLEVIFRANGCEVRLDDRECYLVPHCQGWCGIITPHLHSSIPYSAAPSSTRLAARAWRACTPPSPA